MSLSNDEDEFQSADEDGYDEELKADIEASNLAKQLKTDEVNEKSGGETKFEAAEPEVKQTSATKLERSPSLSDIEKSEPKHAQNETEDDDEEALAERIRERNLKIARKFSAELARSVQASAPIPVKSEPPIGFKVDDIDYPDLTDSETKARPPVAPPPTPALSSSFSAEEPSASSGQESPGTQYGWRMPIKPRSIPTDTPPQECDLNQARAALDKLSEKYSATDKSLFQKVADDLRNVSIKTEDSARADDATPESSNSNISALPSFSGLGQTFSGWNWNSASRILASASQVTSQVSSILDSVANLPQNSSAEHSSGGSVTAQPSVKQSSSSAGPTKPNPKDTASMSATEAVSNDALVDFTLNAMESLGKKAFGVMTHRDESGTLQIKGLGRPWEQLMSTKKPQAGQQGDDKYTKEPETDTNIPTESAKAVESDKTDKKSSVRRRVVNYDDSDKLD